MVEFANNQDDVFLLNMVHDDLQVYEGHMMKEGSMVTLAIVNPSYPNDAEVGMTVMQTLVYVCKHLQI